MPYDCLAPTDLTWDFYMGMDMPDYCVGDYAATLGWFMSECAC